MTFARKCEHCQNKAPMAIVARHSQTENKLTSFGGCFLECETGYVYELLSCPSCERPILRQYFYNSEYFPDDAVITTLYPSSSNSVEALPEQIQRAFDAAQSVKKIDANAFGVLLGRLLEMICDDQQGTGDTLHKKIESLATLGKIPDKLKDIATGLKDLRNVGAHSSLGELTEAEVPIMDELARAIIEYVYIAPALAEQAKLRFAELKQGGKSKKESPNS